MQRLIGVCLLILAAGSVVADEADDADLKKDYAAVEGTWERRGRDEQGREIVMTKTERDGMSSVTLSDAQGNVLHAHHAQYKLERTGQVRIFSYWNRTVTEGPDKGLVDPRPRSYIYRVHDGHFFEIHGLKLQDEQQPSILIWDRLEAKDDKAGGTSIRVPCVTVGDWHFG